MLCPNCGMEVGHDVRLCDDCEAKKAKEREEVLRTDAADDESLADAVDPTETVPYAGFWLRAAALVVDANIIAVALHIVVMPLFGASLQGLVPLLFLLLFPISISILYVAAFESSALQATPGKLLIGLAVTDLEGKRISFLRAVGRYFARFVSNLSFGIGYAMAGFTARKQAAHDMLAGTLVVRKSHVPGFKAALYTVGAVIAGSIIIAALEALSPRSFELSGVEVDTQSARLTGAQPETSPIITSVTRGSVHQAGIEIPIIASVAMYHPLDAVLEIGFYREHLNFGQSEELTSGRTLAEMQDAVPDILFIAKFNPGTSFCDPQAVNELKVRLAQKPGGLPQTTEFVLPQGEAGITDLSCRLHEDAPYRATLRRNDEASGISWDVSTSGRLMVLSVEEKVSYDWTDSIEQVAILNRAEGVLEVGYFETDLLVEDLRAIRETKSLDAVEGKHPAVTIRFELRAQPSQFAPEHLVKYGIVFHRGRTERVDFPGSDDTISFYYVPTIDSGERLWGLGGYLQEGEPVQGGLTHSAEKLIAGGSLKFDWKLEFNTPLIDVDAEPSREALWEHARRVSEPPPTPGTSYARAAAGDIPIEFVEAVALYFPEAGDLVIGFYPYKLSEAEKQEVFRRRALWTFVNNKRPNLVLSLDFRRDAEQAAPENLLSYTAYLYRDKIGSFYFPGQHDRRSFKKVDVELTPDEVRHLSGLLKNGEEIAISIKGQSQSKEEVGSRFTWDVSTTVQIMVAE